MLNASDNFGGGPTNRAAHGADYVYGCEKDGQWHLVAEFFAARAIGWQQTIAAEQDGGRQDWYQENLQSAEERCLEAVRNAMGAGQ